MTTGADRPPYGTRHRKFSPLRPHRSIRPISRAIPPPPGPPRPGPTLSSKRHSSRHAEGAGAADFTQEAGRRKAGVREGDRDVAGVEGVPDPQLGKIVTDPDAAAQVGQRIRILPGT